MIAIREFTYYHHWVENFNNYFEIINIMMEVSPEIMSLCYYHVFTKPRWTVWKRSNDGSNKKDKDNWRKLSKSPGKYTHRSSAETKHVLDEVEQNRSMSVTRLNKITQGTINKPLTGSMEVLKSCRKQAAFREDMCVEMCVEIVWGC